MPLGPGSRFDAYELLHRIGRGGMGEVWLATDVPLGRKVALKLLPAELTRDRSRIARLHQEARAASALNHPNVCTILALGETPEGEHYIAMEYVEGSTLRHRLSSSLLTVPEGLDISIQVASALSAAHSAGIVHRDVKPENIVVRPDGLVKVLDFGLAKLAAPGPDGLTRTAGFHTAPGVALGTVAYMSPEQARAQEVDARTDVWSVGVLVYEMVTGRHPFAAPSSSETLAAILDREPKPLTDVHPIAPSELQRIVTRALRKDPERRYQSMKDLQIELQDLRGDLAGPTLTAPNPTVVPAPTPVPQRAASRKWLVVALAALVLVMSIAGWWWMGTRQGDVQRHVATTPNAGRLTRLTFGNGAQIDASLSPDGKSVAYASDASGNFDIWMQPIGGGEPVQLTTDPAHEWEPAWSPDGQQVLFRSERDGGGLYLLSISDHHLRRIATFGHAARWSPDGKHVLFALLSPRLVQSQLWISDLESDPRPLGATLDAQQNNGAIGWLNGTELLVLYQQENRPAAVSVDVVSGNSRPLSVAGEVTDEFVRLGLEVRPGERLCWGLDGRALYFVGVTNAVADVWSLTIDRQASRIVEGPRRVTTSPEVEGGLTSSAMGSRLAFSAGDPTTRVWLYRLSPDGRQVTGAGEPVSAADMEAVNPALSPDGTRLAVLARRIGGQSVQELLEQNLASGKTRTLRRIDPRDQLWTFRWAPSGDRLSYRLFEERAGRRRVSVRLLDVETGVETEVTTPFSRVAGGPAAFENPWSWSRDGRFIAATSSRYAPGQVALALLPVDGAPHAERSARVLAASDKVGRWGGDISPDGRWVCYNENGLQLPDGSSLGVVPTGGGTPRLLTSGAWDDKPRWSADGRRLYFVSNRGGTFNLWGLEFDPDRGVAVGVPFRLTNYSYTLLPVQMDDPEISVAGSLIAAPLANATSSIWMVE